MTRNVAIFSTHDQALSYRKQLAAKGSAACFGVTATTFAAWLGDAWELYGDGRVLIPSLDRSFAVRFLLEQSSEVGSLEPTDGGIALVCRFFSEAIGLDALEAAIGNPPASLSAQEREFLGLVEPYRAVLLQRGFVEEGDALNVLLGVNWDVSFTLAEGVELPPCFAQFAEKAGIPCTILGSGTERITGLTKGVLPQFLFASGPSAENALISSYVRQACEALSSKGRAGSVLVVTSRPYSVYATLSEALSARGCECVLQARKPFTETHFARAYMAIREFILDDHHNPRALMDFASSPFLAFPLKSFRP